jgi:23S rRNA pseudouridine1911/1915/1917 synthase
LNTRILTASQANRLDTTLAQLLPELSRSAAQRLIDRDLVAVNGVVRDASYRVQPGDSITVTLPDPLPAQLQAEDIALDVLYEDDDVIAVNKRAGMVVHPGTGHPGGTLVNALLSYAPGVAHVGDARRPGIVHRLDKETSGLLVVAKTDEAHRALQSQFKARTIQKTYLALCVGDVQPPRGVIDQPIARDPGNRKRMAVVAGGRESITRYTVTEVFAPSTDVSLDGQSLTVAGRRYSFIRAQPLTGRTHQLRVHFAAIGFPIVGDTLYGAARRDPLSKHIAPRYLLHSSELVFLSPSSGEVIELHAPLPDDMRRVINELGGVVTHDS